MKGRLAEAKTTRAQNTAYAAAQFSSQLGHSLSSSSKIVPGLCDGIIVWGAFSSKPSEQEVQKIRHPLVVEAGTLHLYFHSRTQGRDRLLYGPCLLSHRPINPHDALREVVNGKQSLVPPQTCGRACGFNSTGPGCPPRLRSSSCRSSRLVVSANRPLEGF